MSHRPWRNLDLLVRALVVAGGQAQVGKQLRLLASSLDELMLMPVADEAREWEQPVYEERKPQ